MSAPVYPQLLRAFYSFISSNYFEFTMLYWNTCLVIVGSNLPVVQPSQDGLFIISMSHGFYPDFLPSFFPYYGIFRQVFSGLRSDSILCELSLSSVLVYPTIYLNVVEIVVAYCVFSESRHSKQIKMKIKTVQQIKYGIWEMKGGKYTKTLAKVQSRRIFCLRDRRRNVLAKFIEICMETPCWCPPGWAPTFEI